MIRQMKELAAIFRQEGLRAVFARIIYHLQWLWEQHAFAVLFKLLSPLPKKGVVFLDAPHLRECACHVIPRFRDNYHYVLSNSLTLTNIFHLSTAKVIVLTVEHPFLKEIRSRPPILVNIWHASGAFKKFGMDSVGCAGNAELFNARFGRNDYVICSSKELVDVYSRALQAPIENTLPLGTVRTDVYFDANALARQKDYFFQHYPHLKGKKIYLFAPTFREEDGRRIYRTNLDFNKISTLLKEDEVFLYKLHPALFHNVHNMQNGHSSPPTNLDTNCANVINVSHMDIVTLTSRCTTFITDYSSSIFEAMILNKPIVFFADDHKQYSRKFYLDFEKDLPGELLEEPDEKKLLKHVRKATCTKNSYKEFKNKHLGMCDGNSFNRFEKLISFLANN